MAQTQNITVSGGILTQQFIEALREERVAHPKAQPDSFTTQDGQKPKPAELAKDITAAWNLALEHWETVRARVRELDLPAARRRWIIPFLHLLEFEPHYLRSAVTVPIEGGEELRFSLSHRGWSGDHAPIIHTVAPAQSLDAREGTGRGAKSPHDTLQAYLNAARDETWGIVTNGISLRLLRDFHHTYTKGYVEFDLQNILEERSFSDFLALYRLCHSSRFLPDAEGKPPLEHFYEHCIATGIAVGRDLQGNVKHAIEALANGFLQGELIGKLQRDDQACRDFYSEILHVIYRILFLLYAEQRGMMPGRNSLYAQEYSITALRERAEKGVPARDTHLDLWEGLKVTFRMVEKGVPELGIFPYNGALFSPEKIGRLNDLTCCNSELLKAIRYLTLIEKGRVLQRISYADLGVEEIGSIYESLLEYTPRVTTTREEIDGQPVPANRFILDPRGSGRKTSGSYYTPPQLVNLLIESALKPVFEERVREALKLPIKQPLTLTSLKPEQQQAAEEAILALRVCDPACGSGAFLIAATNFLGQQLAIVRTGDEYPPEAEVRKARRDVLSHCIYGVDLNPMAVELCKVSLWINACVQDLPLNFLDGHIRSGNSLLGVLDPAALEQGIPDAAFTPVTGDNTAVAASFKKRNKQEREGQATLAFDAQPVVEHLRRYGDQFRQLADALETTPEEVQRKANSFQKFRQRPDWRKDKIACDLWTAAFFAPLTNSDDPKVPTTARLRDYLERDIIDGRLLGAVAELAAKHRFFHWHLEFPDVFEAGGFDVVLGNPPWERIKLQEEEHWADDPYIVGARNKAERERRIGEYRHAADARKRARIARFDAAKRAAEATSEFVRESGCFPLTGLGDVNTYALFAELARRAIHPRGRVGVIVQSGIATDDTYKRFFADLNDKQALVSLFDFENRERLFPAVDSRMKFCLLTITGAQSPRAALAFFCHDAEHARDPKRRFALSAAELALLNPNTRTCPVFRSRADAELTTAIYRRVPVLSNEGTGQNPWGISFLRMLDMANDSGLFRTEPGPGLLPLYEAKLLHQFEHRWATYAGRETRDCLPEEKADPAFAVTPRYWVASEAVQARLAAAGWERGWLLGFRDITNATNERTAIFSLLPPVGVGNSAPLLMPSMHSACRVACLLGSLCSMMVDFVTRQKIAGTHMNFFFVKQLPLLPPAAYTPVERRFIVPRVLELVYTAWDIKPFADDVWRDADDTLRRILKRQHEENRRATGGHEWAPPEWAEIAPDGCPLPPFKWDEERRAVLRAELDAYYARLYGLNRKQLRYILDPHGLSERELEDILDPWEDPTCSGPHLLPEKPALEFPSETFRVLKEKEERLYGEYRTRRLVLDAWARLERERLMPEPYGGH